MDTLMVVSGNGEVFASSFAKTMVIFRGLLPGPLCI